MPAHSGTVQSLPTPGPQGSPGSSCLRGRKSPSLAPFPSFLLPPDETAHESQAAHEVVPNPARFRPGDPGGSSPWIPGRLSGNSPSCYSRVSRRPLGADNFRPPVSFNPRTDFTERDERALSGANQPWPDSFWISPASGSHQQIQQPLLVELEFGLPRFLGRGGASQCGSMRRRARRCPCSSAAACPGGDAVAYRSSRRLRAFVFSSRATCV